MTATAPQLEFPVQHFPSAADFERFLDREHATAPGIFVKFAKKGSGIPTISAAEAVETALCFGWIDGRANSIDDNWWTVRYTPRRARSIWSAKNVNTVSRLLAEGRMKPAGVAAVEAAKNDGRWDRAYAGPATITVPEDFAESLARNSAATKTFESLNKTNRYAVLWRIETATPSNRRVRIDSLVQMLAEGKMIHEQQIKTAKKRKPEIQRVSPIEVEAEIEEKADQKQSPHDGMASARRTRCRTR